MSKGAMTNVDRDAGPIRRPDLATLPRIAASDVRLLWVNDWYDGPREAVVEYRGERCLMVLADASPEATAPEGETALAWLLFPLDEARLAEQERWHALFAEHVGDHWCFHGDAHPPAAEPRDPARFYEPRRAEPATDLADVAPVGWLDGVPTA